MTQMQKAIEGKITEEMVISAKEEGVSPEFVRREVSRGRAVIPRNIFHENIKPKVVGRKFKTKINVNIGSSEDFYDIDCELAKLRMAIKYQADTVMDLSVGGDLDAIRTALIKESTIPLGTVPVYQLYKEFNGDVSKIREEDFIDIVEHQAKQGVDFMTIHAGILKDFLEYTKDRVIGIVSRGGGIMASWMVFHKKENPFYTHFDKILEIAQKYDVTLSLGDALRPGALADATDKAQIAELKTLGELTLRAWSKGVQVMIEGPGHVPLNQIEYNIKIALEYTYDAPFYVLGPVVTDIAMGYDHINAAIGATLAAYYGAALLCYVTPREHIGLPTEEDVRQGIVAFKIAAHAADIAKGIPNADTIDKKVSIARANFDWETQIQLSIDPETARKMYEESNKPEHRYKARFCSMCSAKYCPMRMYENIKEKI